MGFFAYHALPGNGRATAAFRFHVTNRWWSTLERRSQRGHLTWERTERLFNDWLPRPQTLYPWRRERFGVRHLRWEVQCLNGLAMSGRSVTQLQPVVDSNPLATVKG
jgi:hypothetical protein